MLASWLKRAVAKTHTEEVGKGGALLCHGQIFGEPVPRQNKPSATELTALGEEVMRWNISCICLLTLAAFGRVLHNEINLEKNW